MTTLDYLTILVYIVGIFTATWIVSKRVTNHEEMFSAARQSPWWVAGLSSFMTLFSAGTFVVWGGIAYRLGFVAIAINTCYGVAALLVGYFVAGHWNRLGISTPAEYVRLRYGKSGLHLFTWTMMLKRVLGVSVSLYALAILLVALVPLGEGHFLRDQATGMLSFEWAVILFGAIVIAYTMYGGLWAVLMTDVLQFIVLTLSVCLMSALMVFRTGSLTEYVQSVPEGFFSPVAGQYGWFFLFGWVIVHFFMVGAEWAFVQRYIAVRSPKDARKSSYLFGVLYLITPAFWFLPPMLYRGVDANINPEQAYILAAQSVLPPGVLGLMFAAMFSATASMVSSQLNVFAGVLTRDFYEAQLNPNASAKTLVRIGQVCTVLIGVLLVTTAIAVPYLGGAEKLIITINSLLVVPLFAPALWGLFSRKVHTTDMFVVALTSFALGVSIRFGIIGNASLKAMAGLQPIVDYLENHVQDVELVTGVILPVLMLLAIEWGRKRSDPDAGWLRIEQHRKAADFLSSDQEKTDAADHVPTRIVTLSLVACGLGMALLAAISDQSQGVLLCFALALLSISAMIGGGARKARQAAG